MHTRITRIAARTAVAAAALLITGGGRTFAPPPGPISLLKATPRTLSEGAWRAAQKTAITGVASRDKKALTFRAKTVHLVVHTGPENDMLSYRIAGLRNPTLVLPRGAVLNILFVNTDDDMLHDLRFTTQRAPFPMQPYPKQSLGTTPLRHRTETTYYSEQLTLRAAPGTYTYLCTVKGHAKGGMFGTLIVR